MPDATQMSGKTAYRKILLTSYYLSGTEALKWMTSKTKIPDEVRNIYGHINVMRNMY